MVLIGYFIKRILQKEWQGFDFTKTGPVLLNLHLLNITLEFDWQNSCLMKVEILTLKITNAEIVLSSWVDAEYLCFLRC